MTAFWQKIEEWIRKADGRKVVVEHTREGFKVELFWRGQCVKRITSQVMIETLKPRKKEVVLSTSSSKNKRK